MSDKSTVHCLECGAEKEVEFKCEKCGSEKVIRFAAPEEGLYQEGDIDKIFGCAPGITGGLSPRKYIEKIRGYEPEWISVKERLPKEYEYVLIVFNAPYEPREKVSYFSDVSYPEWFDVERYDSVTHWMPLPDPPSDKTGQVEEPDKSTDKSEPEWICSDCGKKYGNRPAGLSCWHPGVCGICYELKSVTEPRDFGGLKKNWKRLVKAEKIVEVVKKAWEPEKSND